MFTIPFNIRVSSSEKAAFARAASLAGMTASEWVRYTLRIATMIQLDAVGERAAFMDSEPSVAKDGPKAKKPPLVAAERAVGHVGRIYADVKCRTCRVAGKSVCDCPAS